MAFYAFAEKEKRGSRTGGYALWNMCDFALAAPSVSSVLRPGFLSVGEGHPSSDNGIRFENAPFDRFLEVFPDGIPPRSGDSFETEVFGDVIGPYREIPPCRSSGHGDGVQEEISDPGIPEAVLEG